MKNNYGFTLIELLAVIVVLGIVLANAIMSDHFTSIYDEAPSRRFMLAFQVAPPPTPLPCLILSIHPKITNLISEFKWV